MPPTPKRGCWTCTARKLKCDRGMPTCQKCARSNRQCEGYGLRLSWPKENDTKRTITGPAPSIETQLLTDEANVHFVNTTWQDIMLYRHLSHQSPTKPAFIVRPYVPIWRQPQTQIPDMHLVHYFHESAYLSLVNFSYKLAEIRDALIRMSLTNDTVSGRALLYSLLAIASLRRGGFHQETLKFKVSALRALTASASEGKLSTAEAMQHVAACMLLGTFEIMKATESSGEWLWYTRGAMEVIHKTQLDRIPGHDDMNNILDWVYYHTTVSRFTMSHWRHESVALETENVEYLRRASIPDPLRAKINLNFRSPNPTHTILNLLSETCETLIDPRDPGSQDPEYRQRLADLETRIRNVHLPTSPEIMISGSCLDHVATSVELFRIATLIYLVRGSQSTWIASPKLEALIERAFAIPIQAPSCDHFFPLFIVACEANSDEQRRSVLQLIEKTQAGPQWRSMAHLRAAVEAVWVQKDLHADLDLLINYIGMLNTVISSNKTFPSFV